MAANQRSRSDSERPTRRHARIRRITDGSTPIPIAVAFDHVASALLDRRLGYSSEWERLARRTPAEWDGCLDAGLRRLRW